MPEKKHLERLIARYQRRLQKLKEQQALQGLFADPKILIEIEDIEAKIQQLRLEGTTSLADPVPGEYGDEPKKMPGLNIGSNVGQLAVGGQHVVQFGNVSGGQVSVGPGNVQPQASGMTKPEAREINLAALRQILANLKAQVETEAPLEMKDAALERVTELEEALTTTSPDLDTVTYVKKWFSKNVPALAGVVTDVIVDPRWTG